MGMAMFAKRDNRSRLIIALTSLALIFILGCSTDGAPPGKAAPVRAPAGRSASITGQAKNGAAQFSSQTSGGQNANLKATVGYPVKYGVSPPLRDIPPIPPPKGKTGGEEREQIPRP